MGGALSVNNNKLNLLGKKEGYNLALRHFRAAQGFASDMESGYNLADLLCEAMQNDSISEYQCRSVMSVLLVGKFGYSVKTENLARKVDNVDSVRKAVSAWTNIQLVVVYDAGNGIHVLNPENENNWGVALPLLGDEHIVCYAGSSQDLKQSVLQSAARDFYKLLYGSRVQIKADYKAATPWKSFLEVSEANDSPQFDVSSDSAEASGAETVVVQSVASNKLTAKIAVNVTNELFHNGNVEAWKRIIESYKFKYLQLDVLIWYEGERINDINALFKWGKVKHGVPIMFSVAGEEPKELSKLKKYLFEGASPRFESFLHVAPSSILQLF